MARGQCCTDAIPRGLAVYLLAVLLMVGTGFTVTGVRDVRHAHAIGRSGVPALATVVQHDGHGKYAVLAAYPTPTGTQRGVVPTPHAASSYPLGATLHVLYDPDEPAVVTLASTGGSTTQARTTLAVGLALLALLAAASAGSVVRRRSRDPEARPAPG